MVCSVQGKIISNLIAVWRESSGGNGVEADVVPPLVSVDLIATLLGSSNDRRSRSVGQDLARWDLFRCRSETESWSASFSRTFPISISSWTGSRKRGLSQGISSEEANPSPMR